MDNRVEEINRLKRDKKKYLKLAEHFSGRRSRGIALESGYNAKGGPVPFFIYLDLAVGIAAAHGLADDEVVDFIYLQNCSLDSFLDAVDIESLFGARMASMVFCECDSDIHESWTHTLACAEAATRLAKLYISILPVDRFNFNQGFTLSDLFPSDKEFTSHEKKICGDIWDETVVLMSILNSFWLD